MNEELIVERNGDMQFLAGKMHEDQIAGLQVRASLRATPNSQLLGGRARHANACVGGRIDHQAAAVESAGRRAAEPIGLAEHGMSRCRSSSCVIRRGRCAAGAIRRRRIRMADARISCEVVAQAASVSDAAAGEERLVQGRVSGYPGRGKCRADDAGFRAQSSDA